MICCGLQCEDEDTDISNRGTAMINSFRANSLLLDSSVLHRKEWLS